MNPHEQDLQQQRQKVAVIDSAESDLPTLNSRLRQFLTWFNSGSTPRKLVVLGVALILGFGMIQALFKLIAAVISLALLSLLVYFGYKFIVFNQSQLNR